MIADDQPNPFALLGLPVTATDADIARRAQELNDLAEMDAARFQYRWAREQLLTHPRVRRTYAIFEVPGAVYDDPRWEAFAHRHRRSPVDVRALVAEEAAVAVGDFDLAALVALVLDTLLAVPAPELGPVVADAPVPAGPPAFPMELRDVIFG